MEELYSIIKKEYTNPRLNFKPFYPGRPKFFEFLFRYFWHITKWNKRFDFFKIFLFSKKKIFLTLTFKEKLEKIYNDYFLPLKEFLGLILKNGWKWDFLSIKEYNILVLFMDITLKLEKVTSTKKKF